MNRNSDAMGFTISTLTYQSKNNESVICVRKIETKFLKREIEQREHYDFVEDHLNNDINVKNPPLGLWEMFYKERLINDTNMIL